ncbi:MAG: hypothetical protein WCX79_03960 [Candidatus Paceibacterota bacterium]|jgi:hypothetical protein
MKHKYKIRLIEFFVIGVLFGIAEDLLAITIATEGSFEWKYLWVAMVVAIPFAFISEIIVDHPNFWKHFLPSHWFIKEQEKNNERKI